MEAPLEDEGSTLDLYLVRHGDAVPKEVHPERPLSEAGALRVRRMAQFISERRGIALEDIRHSTKLRARQTAEIFAQAAGPGAVLTEIDSLEPLADVAAIAGMVVGAVDNLMLVGHLPHLSRLASLLVAGDANLEAFDFSEATVLCLRKWGEPGLTGQQTGWQVRWMVTPQLLNP